MHFFNSLSAVLVGSSGLEPPTSRLSGVRSNHLSYEPISVKMCIRDRHDAEPSVPTVVATDEITDSSTAHITDTPANREEDTTVEEHTGYYIEIPTLSKKPAKIILPDGLTRRDLEYIERYAKELFPLFLENLKEELGKAEDFLAIGKVTK